MITKKDLQKPGAMGLVGIDVLLLLFLVWRWLLLGHSDIQLAAVDELTRANRALATDTMPGDVTETYKVLIGAPVFHQDRKYVPPPEVDPVATASPPPDWVMTGYLSLPGKSPKAFVRQRAGGKTMTVTTGDTVEGWTVTDVVAKRVSLQQGERSADMRATGVSLSERGASESHSDAPSTPQALPKQPPQRQSESSETKPEKSSPRNGPSIAPIVVPQGPPPTFTVPPEAPHP